MPAGERTRAFADLVGSPDELDLPVSPEGVPQLGKPFAATGDEDTALIAGRCLCLDRHPFPPVRRLRAPARSPSVSRAPDVSKLSGLSAEFETGRSWSD